MTASRETCPPSMLCPECERPAMPATFHACHGCGDVDCDGDPEVGCAPKSECADPCCDGWRWPEARLMCPYCLLDLILEVKNERAVLRAAW